ncbi:MAG: tripartite tricarboxylate transporter substrate binding protein [Variovorax sp.]|nr:tripartite tricarboxylate transporter substrate binding protein [Variovorax sp.]
MNQKFRTLLCTAALACVPLLGSAQAWPSKTVKVVLPGAPGSSADQIARMLAERLSKKWGQAVVIENKPGVATRLGAEFVARSAPDGYTLLSTFASHSKMKLTYPDAPDPLKDFTPIARHGEAEVAFIVRDDSPYKSLKELTAGVKASNKPLRYAHFGNGSSYHVFGLMMGREAGFDVLPVAYKGETQQMTDLIGGHIESSFNSVGNALPQVQAGKVRALAVVAPARSKVLPDVPTFAELGVPGMTSGGWFGFLAPAGTPQALVDKIAADIHAILQDPVVAKAMRDQGVEPIGSSPRDFAQLIEQDVRQWTRLFAEFNLKVE